MKDNPILKRREDESLKDYEIRICGNKDKYNLNWTQVAEVLNHERGENWGESKYRKWFYAFQEGLDYAKIKDINSSEVLDELEAKKIELLEERKKLQTINVEYNKIAREKARRDLLFEKVKESVVHLPTPKFEPLFNFNKENNEVGILGFGDIHFGKKFKSICNEYSEEIAKERMEELISETVDIVSRHGFEHIHVINGADSIEGMTLRVSQLQSLQSGLIDQTIKFSKFIASWLNELSKYTKITYHHVPSANHAELRPHGSSRGEFPAEDLERVIMNYVHDVLELNDRVEVPLYDNGVIKLNIAGLNMAALHGHQLKNSKTAIRDLSLLHKTFFDVLFVSHFHHGNSLTVGANDHGNVEILQLPSVMGSDEYSDTLMTGAKAGASFFVFEEGKGRTISYNIILN